MTETPRNLGPEIEKGTMLHEQEEASSLREKRLRILGRDGTIKKKGIGTGIEIDKQHGELDKIELTGHARGHDIFLTKRTLDKGRDTIDEFTGRVDGIDIDSDIAHQLFDRYEFLGNWEMGNAERKAVKAQQEFHEVLEKQEAEQVRKDVIEELLSDEPENS